jgi:predicted small secreted protein
MKKLLNVLVACAVLVGLGTAAMGCNTVRGVGKDIERGGEVIQDSTRR